MQLVSLILAIEGFVFGLGAAYYWWQASLIIPTPISVKLGHPMPVVVEAAHMEWICAVLEASTKSGKLNSVAAYLTAWAVGLSAASSVTTMLH